MRTRPEQESLILLKNILHYAVISGKPNTNSKFGKDKYGMSFVYVARFSSTSPICHCIYKNRQGKRKTSIQLENIRLNTLEPKNPNKNS